MTGLEETDACAVIDYCMYSVNKRVAGNVWMTISTAASFFECNPPSSQLLSCFCSIAAAVKVHKQDQQH